MKFPFNIISLFVSFTFLYNTIFLLISFLRQILVCEVSFVTSVHLSDYELRRREMLFERENNKINVLKLN